MERFKARDFMGGSGPGLDRLRAKGAPAHATSSGALLHKANSLALLREYMANGQWPAAILCAAKWPELGDEAAAIHRGREAILRPAFQRQLKRDPTQMVEEAKAALQRRYGNA